MQLECDKIREEILKTYIGRTLPVLFETPKGNIQHGYTENYIPIAAPSLKTLTGEIVNVKILTANTEGCTGEICE